MGTTKFAQKAGVFIFQLLIIGLLACKEDQSVINVTPFELSVNGLAGIALVEKPLKVKLNRNDISAQVEVIKSSGMPTLDSLFLILIDENDELIPEIKPMALSNRDISKLNSKREGAIQLAFRGRLLAVGSSRSEGVEKYKILQRARKFVLTTSLGSHKENPPAPEPAPVLPTFQAGNIPELVKYAKPAVFVVYSYVRGETKGSQGTGFFISDGGIGVSNHHVFEGGNMQYVKTADNQQFNVVQILAESAEYDYVIFRVEPSTTPFRYLKITETPPQEGEEIIVLGNPRGLEGTVTKGIVSALRPPLIQFDAAISPGSSGSPVLNLKGQVVGIATLKLRDCENCNMAFDIKTVLDDIQ